MLSTVQSVTLKTVMGAYANLVVKETPEEHKEKLWYQLAYRVAKYFGKPNKRYKGLLENQKNEINNNIEKLKLLDVSFFEDKDFSPFICMFNILEFLIKDIRDLECRNRFGSYPIDRIRAELYAMDKINKVSLDTDSYMGQVLDTIGV